MVAYYFQSCRAHALAVRKVAETAVELINDPGVNVAYIASNHCSHTDYALSAMAAGKVVLPSYYQHAKIDLFASSCEIGASFVFIEALAGERPVLCSNYPPMPEAAGDAAAYFDPYDPESLAELLARYLDDKSLRDRMGFAAFKKLHKYQWRDTALKTWTALAELAGQS